MGAFKSSEFTENEFQTLCEVIISHALTRELASIGHNIFGATKQVQKYACDLWTGMT